MRDRVEFMLFLKQQAKTYRGCLEGIFGQCDQGFVLGSIKESTRKDSKPHTYLNEFDLKDGCRVDIHIGKEAWQNCSYAQATWQLAHESVHLLDPVKDGEATFLEEGLATWFQNEPKFHSKEVKEYIKLVMRSKKDSPSCYDKAEELVRRCMPQLTSVIKKIRSSDVRIQKITACKLAPYLPNVDKETVEHLCRKMDYT